MPGFLTDNQLKQSLSDCLARASVSTTPTYQTSIITAANNDAWYQILSLLGASGRGLTESQILSWCLGTECQTELGLFFSLMRTGLHKRITRDQLDFYARWIPDPQSGRPTGMLSTTPLIDTDNNPIVPADGEGYQSYGLMLGSIEDGGNRDYICTVGMDW